MRAPPGDLPRSGGVRPRGPFRNVLVIVLIVAAALSAFPGLREPEGTAELLDAALILVIVVLNATLGFVQEYRAERSLQALKALAAPKAHVLREGETIGVPARDLVPGDVVLLAAGGRGAPGGRPGGAPGGGGP